MEPTAPKNIPDSIQDKTMSDVQETQAHHSGAPPTSDELFHRTFADGYTRIHTSAQNYECALCALINSYHQQPPPQSVTTPLTIEQLRDIAQSQQYRELMAETEQNNHNEFGADQTGVILWMWGQERGLNLRLGVRINREYDNTFLVGTSTDNLQPHTIWIHNDNAEEELGAMGHWEGLARSTRTAQETTQGHEDVEMAEASGTQPEDVPSEGSFPGWGEKTGTVAIDSSMEALRLTDNGKFAKLEPGTETIQVRIPQDWTQAFEDLVPRDLEDSARYARQLSVDTISSDGTPTKISVDLEDIVGLKGTDGPPKRLRPRKTGKMPAIVTFAQEGSSWILGNLPPLNKKQAKPEDNPPAASAALSDFNAKATTREGPAEEDEKMEDVVPANPAPTPEPSHSQSSASKKKKDKKGKGKASLDAPADPSEAPKVTISHREYMNVAFHAQSQTPHLEIFTTSGGEEGQLISTKIWAEDIAKKEGGQLHFDIQHADFDGSHTQSDAFQGPGNPGTLKEAALHNALICVTFRLAEQKRRIWSGLPADEIDAIRSRSLKDAKASGNLTRDSAVQYLDKTNKVSIYIRFSSNIDHKSWIPYLEYFSKLFLLAGLRGNFWFYKMQCEEQSKDEDRHFSIEDAALPKLDFVPRWLVDLWTVERTIDANGNMSMANPKPYLWKSHPFPHDYANPKELAFMMKVGVMQEQRRQDRDLQELASSSDLDFNFKGVFHPIAGDNKRYIVEVFINKLDRFQEMRLKLPQPGVAVTLSFDNKDPYNPTKPWKFEGSVVINPENTSGAVFLCVVKAVSKGFTIFAESKETPIWVTFESDILSRQRSLDAITALANIDSTRKPVGVDVKALILGDRAPASNPGYLAAQLSPEALDKATYFIKHQGKRLNVDQENAIMDTLKSKTGLTSIQGPPGTGKTQVQTVISMVHGQSLNRKVLVCAPQNAATMALYDKFKREMRGKRPETYCVFTNAYRTVDSVQNLQSKQSAKHAKHENLAFEFLRQRGGIDKNQPHYEETFGFKLLKQIEAWAAEPDHSQHELACLYFEAQNQFKLIQRGDKDERKKVRLYIESSEALLSQYYLEHVVRFVFSTVNTSAHPLLSGSFHPEVLLIDESAHEGIAAILIAFATYAKTVKHITLAGDHKQGEPIFLAKDSNVGHAFIARNLFAELAESEVKRHSVFLLKICYRMTQDLLDFSSRNCYGGKVVADLSTAGCEQPLRVTLAEYWRRRLPRDFDALKQASVNQLSIDVTQFSKHESVRGTTTIVNKKEAEVVCSTIREMLEFDPPKNGRRILAKDITVVTPYNGQVRTILHLLLEVAREERTRIGTSETPKRLADVSEILVASTQTVKGRENNIVFFSTVVNTGKTRLGSDDDFPISFVARLNNVNVALSRSKISRHIVGALGVMVQACVDGHKSAVVHRPFFEFLRDLKQRNLIISQEEDEYWREHGSLPASREGINSFSGSVRAKPVWDKPDLGVDPKLLRPGKSRFAVTSGALAPQDPTLEFEGNRNEQGQLNPSSFTVTDPRNRGRGRGGCGRGDRGRGRGRGRGGGGQTTSARGQKRPSEGPDEGKHPAPGRGQHGPRGGRGSRGDRGSDRGGGRGGGSATAV